MHFHNRRHASTAAIFSALFVLSLASTGHAVDGVIEINQAKAVAGGVTASDTAGFPVTLDTEGSYRLTSNLSVTSGFDGITITVSNLTIDLNGFEISCNGACASTGHGVVSSFGNITVRDGTIRDFANEGVSLSGAGNRVEQVRTFGNRDGINVGSNATVTSCTSRDNSSDGIVTSFRAHITDNSVENNSAGGIQAGSDSLIHRNIVTNSTGEGIHCDHCNVIGNNVQTTGGDGIDAVFSSVVADNTVEGAGGDGIELSAGGVVTANHVTGCTGFALRGDTRTGYGGNVFNNNNSNGDQVSAGPLEIDSNVCHTDLICP